MLYYGSVGIPSAQQENTMDTNRRAQIAAAKATTHWLALSPNQTKQEWRIVSVRGVFAFLQDANDANAPIRKANRTTTANLLGE